MKSLALLSALLVLASLANAQYFSSGWTPGQPVPTAPAQNAPPRVVETAGKHATTPAKPSFLDSLVTGSPLSALAGIIGFNLTGTPHVIWDERIPLITDSNYVDLVVNEEMTPEEEEKRVWFLVM